MPSDLLTPTFLRLRNRLQAAARRLLADELDAEDALQDAFYRLWQHREEIKSKSQAEGVTVITVRNVCISTLRQRSKHGEYTLVESDTAFEDEADETISDLYSSVKAIIENRLSERERLVITMRDTNGIDFRDIAEELGISEANTRMLLSRARKKVRDIYLSSK